jgi:hypothetical protein
MSVPPGLTVSPNGLSSKRVCPTHAHQDEVYTVVTALEPAKIRGSANPRPTSNAPRKRGR